MQNTRSIIQLCEFIGNQFPLLTLVSLLTITVILVLNEKRRRQLELKPATENDEIENLLKDKKISEYQARALKDATNALPEVVEKYPLPDIHLRLTSALAKTYSLLKIILIFSTVLLLLYIVKVPTEINAAKTIHTDGESWFFLTLYFLIIILSIAQFTASIKVTRGSVRSKNVLLAIWLFDLLLLPLVLHSSSIVYQTTAVATAAYSIWVLAWRKNAAAYLRFNAVPGSFKYKLMLIAVFATCVAFGVYFVNYRFSYTYSCSGNENYSTFSAATVDGCIKLDKLAVVATSSDRETAELTELIVQKLRVELPALRVELLSYKDSFKTGEVNFDLFLLVSRAELIPSDREKGQEIIKRLLAKDQLPDSPLANLKMSGKRLTFRFDLVDSSEHQISAANSLLSFSRSSISGSMVVSENYYGGSVQKALEHCAADTAGKLARELKKYLSQYTRLNLPEWLASNYRQVSFQKIPFLKNGWCLGCFRSVYNANFSIFLFPLEDNRKRQRADVIEQMTKAGFSYRKGSTDRKELYFVSSSRGTKNSQVRIYLPLHPEKGNFTPIALRTKAKAALGRFLFAESSTKIFDFADLQKLKKFDFATCALSVNFSKLNKLEMEQLLDTALEHRTLDFNTLDRLYTGSGYKKFDGGLDKKRAELLVKMGEVLGKNVDEVNFAGDILKLINAIIKENRCALSAHPAFKAFKKFVLEIRLKHGSGKNIYAGSRLVRYEKNPVIFKISGIGKSRKDFFAVLNFTDMKGDKGTISLNAGSAASSCSFDASKYAAKFISRCRFSNEERYSTLIGEGEVKVERFEPDSLGVSYSYDPKHSTFEVKVMYIPQKK
ncbi:hypothetical protein P0136_02530 [Lentisphaerota bacterium ZTH]|nr:hypothetical protein JYG24_06330 [Lentisphaerota bacterium]WET06878.1 hypothetical protein P0136_02530 [Lentisphaerota bacterium ZTH]